MPARADRKGSTLEYAMAKSQTPIPEVAAWRALCRRIESLGDEILGGRSDTTLCRLANPGAGGPWRVRAAR